MSDPWIQIPGHFGERQAIALLDALRAGGIEWRRTEAPGVAGRGADTLRHVIHVPAASVRPAARLVGEALGLEDPERAQPFTGECPACSESIADAWTCPSCELSFRCTFDAKDPTICFVREHGGFDET